ncbi:porin [Pelagivirga sediminicola]|uniref:Porin n=2 Tax=Pelagivirga sediminicola TaxID=2170575 RepID=A0A2T7GAF3_9RHOB|nr:porin [Pelagivirga sediminicola]
MAAPAAAQEWDVSFGGFMSQHVAYADISGSAVSGEDHDGVDLHSNTEIHFSPSITLDNGLTFGAHVEFEGENQTGFTQIDESYMTISSDTLGQIIIGSENSAGYKSMVGAPGVTSMYINSPSISTFIPFSAAYPGGFRQAGLSSYTEVGGNNDVQRLTYFTPSFNGLTVGISYAPTGSLNVRNSYGVDRNSVMHDIFDIGVNYSQTFGTTSVTLAARYGTAESANTYVASDPETWGVGAQLGFGDFTVGASYSKNDNDISGVPVGTAAAGDSEGWSLGVTYDMAGPWAFEALTYQGEADAIDAAGNISNNAEYEAYRIGASRDLGPGVSWDVYVAHVKADNGRTGADYEDVKGTIIGTGINLSF